MTATFVAPDNPGVNVELIGERTIRPNAAAAATVGVPFVSDWGPVGQLVRMNGFGEYDSNFGNTSTDGRRAVLGTFIGPGNSGNPGAGSVIGYRMATEAAAQSKLTVKNTKEGGKNALELLGLYKGTRGDRISTVVENDPSDEAKDRLRILFDGLTVEKYSYAKANIAALVAAINKGSNYVEAKTVEDGTALTHTAGTSLAGGNDGSTLTSAEWLAALASFEYAPVTIIAPYDLEDEAIQAAAVAWIETQKTQMKPVEIVLGGPAEEDLTEAIERTAAYESEHVVSLGAGAFHDSLLDADVSTAKLAPRIAGALAGLGEEKSLTNLKFTGIEVLGEPAVATDQLSFAAENGVVAFRRTSSEEAELKVAKGVTSYTADTDTMPLEIFGDPRQVRVIDLFIREIVEWGNEYIVGPTRVTDATMAAVKAKGEAMLADRRDKGLILPGASEAEQPYFHTLDPESVGAPLDSIPFEFGWKFARTTNYMIGRGRVF